MKEIVNNNPLANKKNTYSSEYLYGVKGSYFKNLLYKEAIVEKIRLGRKLLSKLTDFVYGKKSFLLTKDEKKEYSVRINDVSNAIDYNELLLKDMKE